MNSESEAKTMLEAVDGIVVVKGEPVVDDDVDASEMVNEGTLPGTATEGGVRNVVVTFDHGTRPFLG